MIKSVWQVLDIKSVNSGVGAPPRYKLTLTDGLTTVPAMIAQQISHLVTDEIIKLNCIVKVKNYLLNTTPSARFDCVI